MAPRCSPATAVASINRWGKRDAFGQALMAATDELSAPDDKTIVFRLKRPFPLLPDALGKVAGIMCAIMPERLASTDAFKPLNEMVGSGPFRYVAAERVPGALSVYTRFEGYVPRPSGTPSCTAGPKVAYLDRIEWGAIPDPATAMAALQQGQVDWWQEPSLDLLGVVHRNNGPDHRQRWTRPACRACSGSTICSRRSTTLRSGGRCWAR